MDVFTICRKDVHDVLLYGARRIISRVLYLRVSSISNTDRSVPQASFKTRRVALRGFRPAVFYAELLRIGFTLSSDVTVIPVSSYLTFSP